MIWLLSVFGQKEHVGNGTRQALELLRIRRQDVPIVVRRGVLSRVEAWVCQYGADRRS